MTNQQKAENNEIDESEYNYQKEQGANFKDMNNEYYAYDQTKAPAYEYEGRYYDTSMYEGGYYDNQPYDSKPLYDSKTLYDSKPLYDTKQLHDNKAYEKQMYEKQMYEKQMYEKQMYENKPYDSKMMMYDNSYYDPSYSAKEKTYYDMGSYNSYQSYPKVHRESKRKAKQRICSNCSTTSTPSWRRGENGKSLLCNACGLYQKLHGRARPYTVTPNGRTKALKGGYEKTLCVSCNNLYPISEVKGGTNAHVCDNCMTHIKNTKELDYQYYRYGNYYNYYANADVNIDNTVDVNNTIYENIQKDKPDEKD